MLDIAPATATRRVLAAARMAPLMADGRPEGCDWYREGQLEIARLAEEFGLSLRQGIGIVAALSPQKDWPINLTLAWECCRQRTAHGQTGDNLAKALRILDGEDYSYVLARPPKAKPSQGEKVRSFAANFWDPGDPVPVTIDRHILSLIVGRKLAKPELHVLGNSGVYDFCADAFRRAGPRMGLLPSEIQAVCWLLWTTHLRRKRLITRLPTRIPVAQAA